MDIPGISASDGFFNPFGASALGRDAFLQLLVTQLEHQDPLEPIQNEDFVAQLATFSSLEQLEELNGNVIAMIALNQSNALLSQLTQSSALIGKSVRWIDPETGEAMIGTVDSVRIVDGLAVLQVGDHEVPLAAVTEVLEDVASVEEGMLEEEEIPDDDIEIDTEA